uniref:Uncharacterized protein n=1 Tax=Cacopsylla melanoneura TaxID=428564 RepID=A0A8D9BKQ7_9HEMI
MKLQNFELCPIKPEYRFVNNLLYFRRIGPWSTHVTEKNIALFTKCLLALHNSYTKLNIARPFSSSSTSYSTTHKNLDAQHNRARSQVRSVTRATHYFLF